MVNELNYVDACRRDYYMYTYKIKLKWCVNPKRRLVNHILHNTLIECSKQVGIHVNLLRFIASS